jgi:putative transposase
MSIAGYPHHVVHRGHNRQPVFLENADRRIYLAALARFKDEFDVKVYAYCLMTNHVHLILQPGDAGLAISLLMRRLAGRHARRLNVLTARTGSAWEGRFKCSPIETDRYLLACSRYVELNPVRAGIVARPDDFAWSSYRAKLGMVRCNWLDADPCFLGLGDTVERRRRRYREFVEQGISAEELATIRSAVQGNQPTASDARLQDARDPFGACAKRPRGRPKMGTGLFSETRPMFEEGQPGNGLAKAQGATREK